MTGVFTVERTLRRTLRQLVVSAGFASKYADKIVGGLRGLDAVKNSWEIYDPQHKPLTEIVAIADWSTFKSAAEKRNKMIHGERVYELETCKREAEAVLDALGRLKAGFDARYGYSGWERFAARQKSRLHVDPKVHVESQQAPRAARSARSDTAPCGRRARTGLALGGTRCRTTLRPMAMASGSGS
ncbi:MAG: hypothetical protein V2J02_21690 [Pseudomonadales bacterium]|nr:hypothetical protein [Pseudomonadales bacterium]